MRKATVGLLVALLIVLSALPASAGAAKVKHRGTLAADPAARVEFTVKKKKRSRRVTITGMRFLGLPVTCTDGASGPIDIELDRIRTREKRLSVQGPLRGAENGTVVLELKFRKGTRRAKGTVAVGFTSPSGASCTSGEQQWSTRK